MLTAPQYFDDKQKLSCISFCNAFNKNYLTAESQSKY